MFAALDCRHKVSVCRDRVLTATGEGNDGHALNPSNVAGSLTPVKNQLLIEHPNFPGSFWLLVSLCIMGLTGKMQSWYATESL